MCRLRRVLPGISRTKRIDTVTDTNNVLPCLDCTKGYCNNARAAFTGVARRLPFAFFTPPTDRSLAPGGGGNATSPT